MWYLFHGIKVKSSIIFPNVVNREMRYLFVFICTYTAWVEIQLYFLFWLWYLFIAPLIHLGTPYLTPPWFLNWASDLLLCLRKKAQKSVPMNLRTVVMFTMKFLWSGPCSYLSDIDDNSKFITRNVRILAYFLSGFCQDCQDIWYPFGSGHHERICLILQIFI